jgi:signal transduction histidine kinase/CheY-like chemotaxis protein
VKAGSLKNLSTEDVQRLELLSRVGKRINTPDNFNDALQAILDAVVDSLEAERGAIFLTDLGHPPELILAVDRSDDRTGGFTYSKTVVEKVFRELTPLAVVDAQGDEDLAGVVSIQAQGIRSVICVPLIGRQSILGLIYLDNRLSNAFTGPDLQMLDIIADLAATALERARFFEALQKLNDSLEATVNERTAEAEAARQEAERATEAKSLFLANMSHELRTPLNGVLGLTEDLLRDETAPSLRLRLEQIGFSARSLSTLVNGILDFSKLESGRVMVDNHPFTLELVLKTVLATVAYSAQEKGIELIVTLDPAVPSEVEGDSTRLKQILINLLANAVKFTEAGWVELSLECPRPGHILFAVSDSGIGIAPEKQRLIFEPFSQADASTTRQFGGTGLGLSICHSLTELLGGELQVESQLGQGSRFFFEIPMRALKPYQLPKLSGVKIWVEDPEPHHQASLLALLRSWGAQVVTQPEQCQVGIASRGEQRLDFPCLHLVSNYEMRHQKIAEVTSETKFMLRPVLREELAENLLELLEQKGGPVQATRPRSDDFEVPKPPPQAVMLVAEDHEINQLVTQRMVESWGYTCQFATSGLDVVRLFAEARPHLILMDIEMPGVDGFAATRQIRGLEEAHKAARANVSPGHDFIPILAVTAHLAPDLRARCLEAGMDDLLAKPLSRSLLAGRLVLWEQVLQGQVPRRIARLRGHKELSDWPGRFLSEVHAALSTLSIVAEREDQSAKELTAGRLERLAFAAGLTSWGGRLVNWRTGRSRTPLNEIVTDLMQEWKTLAPTLLGRGS